MIEKISKKEKLDLKDEIVPALLTRAFSKLSRVYAYFDTKNHLLLVNTCTGSKLEKFSDLFKKTFADISFKSLETKKITFLLTEWILHDTYPDAFSIEKACVMRDPNEKERVIRCQQQDLSSDPIQALLKGGCQVDQLALNWQDRINFVLTENFTLKNIQYQDEVLDLAKDNRTETAEQRFDADFIIMTETLSALLQDLIPVFQRPEEEDPITESSENLTLEHG